MKVLIFILLSCTQLFAQDTLKIDKYTITKVVNFDSLGLYASESFIYSNDKVYFSDFSDQVIRVFDFHLLMKDSILYKTLGYGKGKGPGENLAIVSIGVLNDTVYIADKSLNKISIWKEDGYISDVELDVPNLLPTYMCISATEKNMYFFSSNLLHAGKIFQKNIYDFQSTPTEIVLTEDKDEGFFLKDVKRVAKDGIVVIGSFHNPFIYIYDSRINLVKKIRTSIKIDKNKMIESKGFLGKKTLKAKYMYYFNMGLDIDEINKKIIVGLSETEYSNIEKILIMNYEGQILNEKILQYPINSFFLTEEFFVISRSYYQNQYNKLYILDKKNVYE